MKTCCCKQEDAQLYTMSCNASTVQYPVGLGRINLNVTSTVSTKPGYITCHIHKMLPHRAVTHSLTL